MGRGQPARGDDQHQRHDHDAAERRAPPRGGRDGSDQRSEQRSPDRRAERTADQGAAALGRRLSRDPRDPAGPRARPADTLDQPRDVEQQGLVQEPERERRTRQQGETGTWQMFFLDVNGAKVELNFASDEPEAPALRTR